MHQSRFHPNLKPDQQYSSLVSMDAKMNSDLKAISMLGRMQGLVIRCPDVSGKKLEGIF